MRRIRPLVLVPLCLLASASFAAGQQRDPKAPIPLDPLVRAGRLDNGLQYFVRANTKPEKRAQLMLVVNAGSVLEDDDQLGLAHVVEHMSFNGTAHFRKQELVNYLESIGMQFGADLNAYTGFDETVYVLTVPTDTGSALERGVQILEDWAHEVSFDSTEVEKERGVVVEEWRLGQGAGARLRDQVFPVLFGGSRYAVRLPIGTKESIETFKRPVLLRFYNDWYRPDLMAVVAVGDFDAARVESMIRQKFTPLRNPTKERARANFPVSDHPSPQVVVATDPEATGTSVNVYYGQPVAPTGTFAAYRRSLVAQLYNGMLNARLGELAQQADPPFVGASSTEGALVRTRGAYSVGAAVREGEILRGLDAILTEAARVARHGFTATELQREKSDMLRYYESAFAERDKTESSDYADEYARHFLEGEGVPGITLEYDLVREYLPAITLADVNALAGVWMTAANRVVVVQAPKKAGQTLPSGADLLAAFTKVQQKDIAPYHDVVAVEALVPAPPSPGTITSERRYDNVGVTEWRLSNGVRVLLKPTDFKADEVLVRGFSPGGLSLVSDSDYVSGGFSTTLVRFSGLGSFDATQLQKVLAGKAVNVQPAIDDLTEGVLGSASPKDLETLLQLVWLTMTAPREDSVAFRSLMTRLRGVVEQQQASPEVAFSDTLTVTLAQHHQRSRPVTPALLDEIDRTRAFRVYRDRFADASDFTFVLVGSFQPDSVRPLVLRWLGGLPSSRRTESWKDDGERPPTGVVTRVVHSGAEPKSRTAIVFTGPLDYSRENLLLLRSLGDALEIRLREVLREELGGTYDVSVQASGARDPWAHYSFTVDFGAAPERLDSLVNVVFTEIAKLQTAGPDSATLQKVQENQRRTFETSMKENGFWLNQLVGSALQGTDPGTFLNTPALIDAVTPQRIAGAARDWLVKDRYVRVSLMPVSTK